MADPASHCVAVAIAAFAPATRKKRGQTSLSMAGARVAPRLRGMRGLAPFSLQ